MDSMKNGYNIFTHKYVNVATNLSMTCNEKNLKVAFKFDIDLIRHHVILLLTLTQIMDVLIINNAKRMLTKNYGS